MAETSTRHSRSKNRKIWIVVAIVIVVVAIFVDISSRRVVQVRMAQAKRGELISTLSTNGKVFPVHNFAAYSPTSGTVKAVYVHQGEKVSAGQLLLTMDDSEAKSAVTAALAAVRGAEAQLQALRSGGTRPQQITLAGDIAKLKTQRDQDSARLATLEKLQKQGAASDSEVTAAENALAADTASLKVLKEQQTQNFTPIDLEHAQANVANAKAAYASALDTLKKENVRAPFAGTIYALPVRPSDFVSAGDRLLQLADLKQIQITAYFDEPEIGKLSVGDPVTIVWEAKPGRAWHGHILRTPTTIINFGTRNVGEALVSVDDSDETLLPNTNVTITVTLLDLHDVLIVPREAFHSDTEGDYVFKVEDGKLQRVPVKIGALNLTQVQILSGIPDNATVALSAPDGSTLHNGLAVRRAH